MQFNPTQFIYHDGQLDFAAPVPFQFFLTEFPSRHDPNHYIDFFHLSHNWMVQIHPGDELQAMPEREFPGFRLYCKRKQISILSPSQHCKTFWEIFRLGDVVFLFDHYSLVRQCSKERHVILAPPFCVIKRFIDQFCPPCS